MSSANKINFYRLLDLTISIINIKNNTENVYGYTSRIVIECFSNVIFVSNSCIIMKYFSATRFIFFFKIKLITSDVTSSLSDPLPSTATLPPPATTL